MKNSNVFLQASNSFQYFEVQRHMDMHDRRIRNAQPTLKGTWQPTHRSCNHIKKQPLAQFNRIVTIDIENKALLKKLTDKSPSRIGRQKPYKLIKNNRKKNLEDYQQRLQNQGLLKRIRQAKSSYLNCKFASERKVTESYINAISKFGFRSITPNKVLMLPFDRKTTQRLIKGENNRFNSFDSDKGTEGKLKKNIQDQEEKQIKINSDNHQIDKVVLIQTLPIGGSSSIYGGHTTYIVWQKKVAIQINLSQEEKYSLEIPKHIFQQFFQQNIHKLHQNIRFDELKNEFFIDLPKKKKLRKYFNKQNSYV